MIKHLRRLFKQSVVYGLAETVSRGTGFLLGYMYIRVLSLDDIGNRSGIYTVSALVSVFYTLGLDTAFLRYFLDKDLQHKQKAIFSSAMYFTLAVGLGFLASVWFKAGSLSLMMTDGGVNSSYIVRLLFLIILLDTVVIFPTLVLRAENRMYYFSLISFSRFFLFIVLNIILVWFLDRGLVGVFEANLLVVAAVAILLIPVYIKYLRPVFSFAMLRKLLAFGLPTIFTLLCMRIIDFADRQMILRMLGSAENGMYEAAYKLGMVGIVVFVNSFRLAWHPFYLSMRDSAEKMGLLFARVTTFYTVFIGLAFLGITLFRREIFYIYTSPRIPQHLSAIVPVVSFSYIFFGLYIIMLSGFFIKEKTKLLPIVSFSAASVNVLLNLVFIPKFGVAGAAYTTVISYVVMAGVTFVISRRVYHVPYEYGRLTAAFSITALAVVAQLLYEPSTMILSYIYRIALLCVPIAYYLMSDFLNDEERSFVADKLSVFRRSN